MWNIFYCLPAVIIAVLEQKVVDVRVRVFHICDKDNSGVSKMAYIC